MDKLVDSVKLKGLTIKQKGSELARVAQVKSEQLRNEARLYLSQPPPSQYSLKTPISPLFGQPLAKITVGLGVSVPPIVNYCIEFLDRHLDEVGLYRVNGSVTKIEILRSRFEEKNYYIPDDTDPSIVASTLKAFIREIPDKLLDGVADEFNDYISQISEAELNFSDSITLQDEHFLTTNVELMADMKFLISRLPVENWDLLYVLLKHLSKVASNYQIGKMGLTNLLLVWSLNLNITGSLFAFLVLNHEELQLTRDAENDPFSDRQSIDLLDASGKSAPVTSSTRGPYTPSWADPHPADLYFDSKDLPDIPQVRYDAKFVALPIVVVKETEFPDFGSFESAEQL